MGISLISYATACAHTYGQRGHLMNALKKPYNLVGRSQLNLNFGPMVLANKVDVSKRTNANHKDIAGNSART